MNDELLKAVSEILDEISAMTSEEFQAALDKMKSDPLYGIFEELEEFGKWLYAEYDSTQYNINMPWETRDV